MLPPDGQITIRDEHGAAELDELANVKNVRQVSRATRALAGLTSEAFAAPGGFPIIVGGDHSLAIGSVSAALDAAGEDPDQPGVSRLGVVWIDAHADINSRLTSPSGNLHGMPLSLLLGIDDTHRLPAFRDWVRPAANHVVAEGSEDADGYVSRLRLDPSRLCFIGLRDVDAGERRLLRDHNITSFSMHQVDKLGIGTILNLILTQLGPTTPLHLSFDIDSLSPEYAPSTGTRVKGGLSLREGLFSVRTLGVSGRLQSMDIVEVNPSIGRPHQVASTAAAAVAVTAQAVEAVGSVQRGGGGREVEGERGRERE
jgi:arginase